MTLVTKHQDHLPYSKLSSKAWSQSSTQEILCPSQNLKVHYVTATCHCTLPTVKWLHCTPYIIHNNFKYCTPIYAYVFKWIRFYDQNFECISLHHLYYISSSFNRSSWQYLVNHISYKAPHYTVILQPALACSILGPNVIPSILSSNITDLNWSVFIIYHVLNWSLYCIFHARGQISHPCKSTCNNLVQNTLSLVCRQQERRHKNWEQNSSRNCLLSISLQFHHKHNFSYCRTQTELYFYSSFTAWLGTPLPFTFLPFTNMATLLENLSHVYLAQPSFTFSWQYISI